MGIVRNFLRKWRERRDGTLEGPALSTEELPNNPDFSDGFTTRAKDPDYNIWMSDGGTIYANSDGSSVRPTHSGGTINEVLSSVLGDLDDWDRYRQAVLSFKGEFEVIDEITQIRSHTHLDFKGSMLYWEEGTGGDNYMFHTNKDDPSRDFQDVTFYGGNFIGEPDPESHFSNGDAARIRGNHVDGSEPIRFINCRWRNFRRGPQFVVRRTHLRNVSSSFNQEYGFYPAQSDQHWQNCISYENSERGFHRLGNWNHYYHCVAHNNGMEGVRVGDSSGGSGANAVWHGGYSEHNGGPGFLIELTGELSLKDNFTLEECRVLGNEEMGIDAQSATGMLVDHCVFHPDSNVTNGQTTAINIASGVEDARLRDIIDPDDTGITDSGTRTRWDGVIGGGPLGGIDLSSVSGTEDGQEAMSDGTATDFPALTRATWDAGNSQWVRVDGQATSPPA